MSATKDAACTQQQQLLRQCKVAVIGAGASGLVAARELRREGHEVVVFEQQTKLGGTWLYTDEVDSDLSGHHDNRQRVHSSMYQGLTTNLPREIMGFIDFVFSPYNMAGGSVDARRYPCSDEVLRYLQAFANHYHLHDLIQFNTQVVRATPSHLLQNEPTTPLTAEAATAAAVPYTASNTTAAATEGLHCSSADGAVASPMPPQQVSTETAADDVSDSHTCIGRTAHTDDSIALPWPRWIVEWKTTTMDAAGSKPASKTAHAMHKDVFDAVLVCNGHYSEPQLPQLPGAVQFPGLIMHSHNYRSAGRFKGQHVAVIGASFSGLDIARLVSEEAQQVYVCAREWKTSQDLTQNIRALAGRSNIQLRGMITHLAATGGAEFSVGAPVPHLDAVICCTGYQYCFPFLHLQDLGLSTAQQHVSPLYQHMFHPGFGPGLAFIGLPWRVVPFPMFELQSKLCARLLSGRSSLPAASEMEAWITEHQQQLLTEGLPATYSHYMDYQQLSYHRWLAKACGHDVPLVTGWRSALLHGYWLWRMLAVMCSKVLLGRRSRSRSQPTGNSSSHLGGSASDAANTVEIAKTL